MRPLGDLAAVGALGWQQGMRGASGGSSSGWLGNPAEMGQLLTVGMTITCVRQLATVPAHQRTHPPPCRCVTPYIMVPGKWSAADMEYVADSVAAGLTNNAGGLLVLSMCSARPA